MSNTEPTDPAEETVNWEYPDRTTEARIRTTRLPEADTTRRAKSAPRSMECAPRRTPASRSPTQRKNKPEEFLTGIEHKTKFMRDMQSDKTSQKFGINSGVTKPQQTRPDTRAVNKWRQNILNTCLEKQPKRKEEAKRCTEASSNLSRTFPNRKQPQLNKSAEVRIRHALDHLGAKSKISGKARPSITANRLTRAKAETSETTNAGEISKHQKISKVPTLSSATFKLDTSAIHSEEIPGNLKPHEDTVSLTLEQTSYWIDPNAFDNLMQGINKAGLSINLPKSPRCEQKASNSPHTTPRSQMWHSVTAETLSVQTGNNLSSSETLEVKTSSPRAKVSSSTTPRSSSHKYKFFPSSDNIQAHKSRESFAKSPRNKQEPVTFTTQFVPLLRWTNKTDSGGLFEPNCNEGLNNRPNSTNSNENSSEGGPASNDKTSETELLSQLFKETASSSDGNAVPNECYIREQQEVADEDYYVQHPSLMWTSGEGENLTNVRRAKKKSTTQDGTFSKDGDRSHTRNPVKQDWKLTGPQQIVSGSALNPATTPPLLRRPQSQSVRNVAMAKQPAAYMRSANQPVGDYARQRPTSSGARDKRRAATGNKKPVWK